MLGKKHLKGKGSHQPFIRRSLILTILATPLPPSEDLPFRKYCIFGLKIQCLPYLLVVMGILKCLHYFTEGGK
jgi:hypothetical protein